jgi:hypothetical protein
VGVLGVDASCCDYGGGWGGAGVEGDERGVYVWVEGWGEGRVGHGEGGEDVGLAVGFEGLVG